MLALSACMLGFSARRTPHEENKEKPLTDLIEAGAGMRFSETYCLKTIGRLK